MKVWVVRVVGWSVWSGGWSVIRVVRMVRVVGVVRVVRMVGMVEVVRMVGVVRMVRVVRMVTLLVEHYFVQISVGRWSLLLDVL